MAGDMADSIEWFAADYDMLSVDCDDEDFSECGTEYWSPCCGDAVYAHFMNDDLIGFACADCGKSFDENQEF